MEQGQQLCAYIKSLSLSKCMSGVKTRILADHRIFNADTQGKDFETHLPERYRSVQLGGELCLDFVVVLVNVDERGNSYNSDDEQNEESYDDGQKFAHMSPLV